MKTRPSCMGDMITIRKLSDYTFRFETVNVPSHTARVCTLIFSGNNTLTYKDKLQYEEILHLLTKCVTTTVTTSHSN